MISGGGGVPLRSKKDPEEMQELLHDFRNDGYDVVLVNDEEIFHYLLCYRSFIFLPFYSL